MNISFNEFFHEIFFGSLSITLNLFKIIIPLMILIEFILAFKLIEKLAPKLTFITKILGVSSEAVLPILVGLFIGVTYSAGALLEMNKKTPFSKKDLMLISIFLFSCHGIIETTLLLGNAGANVIFISLIRLLIAIFITGIFARIIKK